MLVVMGNILWVKANTPTQMLACSRRVNVPKQLLCLKQDNMQRCGAMCPQHQFHPNIRSATRSGNHHMIANPPEFANILRLLVNP